MKSIDDAIKHCEEVAHQNEILMKRYDDASGYNRSHNEKIRTNGAKGCEQLISLYRQLAEWLRTLKAYGEARKAIEGTIEELKKSGDDTYIKGLELAEQIIHELVDEEECE